MDQKGVKAWTSGQVVNKIVELWIGVEGSGSVSPLMKLAIHQKSTGGGGGGKRTELGTINTAEDEGAGEGLGVALATQKTWMGDMDRFIVQSLKTMANRYGITLDKGSVPLVMVEFTTQLQRIIDQANARAQDGPSSVTDQGLLEINNLTNGARGFVENRVAKIRATWDAASALCEEVEDIKIFLDSQTLDFEGA